MSEKEEPHSGRRDRHHPDPEEAVVVLPDALSEDGIYAVSFSQAEMYDLGNIRFISHYVFVDRKAKICIDCTSVIKQAPLLSRVPDGQILPEESYKIIDGWLTQKEIPMYFSGRPGIPEGVKRLEATKVPCEATEALRQAMQEVAQTRAKFDAATTTLHREVDALKDLFVSKELD